MSSWWQKAAGVVVSVGLPIIGNMVCPGIGGLIGGAVGGVLDDLINGDVNGLDLARDAGLGALGSFLGGGTGKLLGKGAAKITDDLASNAAKRATDAAKAASKAAKVAAKSGTKADKAAAKAAQDAADSAKAAAKSAGTRNAWTQTVYTKLGDRASGNIFRATARGLGSGLLVNYPLLLQLVGHPDEQGVETNTPEDIGNAGSADMPHVWMPGKDAKGQPVLTAPVSAYYHKLPGTMKDLWVMMGAPPVAAPPTPPAPPKMDAAALGDQLPTYADTVKGLNTAMEQFVKADAALAKITGQAADNSATGKQGITDVLQSIQDMAPGPKKTGPSWDQYALELVSSALQQGQSTVGDAQGVNGALGATIDNNIPQWFKDYENQMNARLDNQDQTLKNLAGQTPTTTTPEVPQVPNYPTDTTTPTVPNYQMPTTPNTDPSATNPNGTNPNGTNPTQDALDRLNQAGANPDSNIPPVQNPANTPVGAMGSGFDPMSMMMPALMSGMMDRNTQPDPFDDEEQRDELRRRNQEQAAAVQPVVAPQQQAQATPGQPDPNAAQNQQTGPPSGATTAPTTNGTPPRTPGPDGSVTYTYPDGRTQKVSVVVAQALDAAFGNAAGTDAQLAYEKTPAKWQGTKKPGDRVDPYKLITGDVAKWDHTAAIVVAFGADGGGSLENIINGQLQPFAAEMEHEEAAGPVKVPSDYTPKDPGKTSGGDTPKDPGKTSGGDPTKGASQFGTFVGFFHPRGIEIVAPAHDSGSAPGTPPGTDHADHAAAAAAPGPLAIAVPAQ